MGAGVFRESVQIQSPPTGRDEYGAPIKGALWNTFLTTRASYEPLVGRELFTAEQAGSQVDVRFRIRYRAGITNNFRVLYRGISYQILYPIEIGNRQELLLYCKKVS
jgi:SPP1 family predicted phage head-tail adaptor